ncbi:MAG: gliding motility-associated C-terminal domain-containing protein [Flavobacteriaceae bacterium]
MKRFKIIIKLLVFEKRKSVAVMLFFIFSANAQTAFHNLGNVQIHDNGQMGFHTNLINNGMFNQNLGLVGFYSATEALTISGTQVPRFFNMETAVNNHLYLGINTEIASELSYIVGDIITPRENPDISLDFLGTSYHTLVNNLRDTDGYASVTGINRFTFPIGHDDKYRPLIIPNQDKVAMFKAAYFNEDPNFPSTFPSFSTSVSEAVITKVSVSEFWDFNGAEPTQVTLTWDADSNIADLAADLSFLRVVGWSVADNEWKNLGNVKVTGNLTEGTITSFAFIPDHYQSLTFGTINEDAIVIGTSGIVIHNAFSPNGDGKNDTFFIEDIELFENTLKIYNRWGHLVYEAKNYKNDWNGSSEFGLVINKGKKLPTGTYFYVLELPVEKEEFSSWLYIVND